MSAANDSRFKCLFECLVGISKSDWWEMRMKGGSIPP